jgi:NTE family protein
MYFNGVFEGGGVKGIAYIGALKALADRGFNPYRVAGTSVGAIIASLVACGYTPEELKNIMDNLNLDELRGKNAYSRIKGIGPVINMLISKGMYNITPLEKQLDELYRQKSKARFIDLKRGDDYILKVIVTDLTSRRLVIIPNDLKRYNIDPDSFPISKGVAMSSCLPFYYEPMRLLNNLVIDGGLVSNFPVWIFSQVENVPTIGFNLYSNKERPSGKNNFLDYVASIATSGSINKYRSIDKKIKIMNINTFDIKATDFGISSKDKHRLYLSGYASAMKFLSENNYKI